MSAFHRLVLSADSAAGQASGAETPLAAESAKALPPAHPCSAAAQRLALRDGLPERGFNPDASIDTTTLAAWAPPPERDVPSTRTTTTRGEALLNPLRT